MTDSPWAFRNERRPETPIPFPPLSGKLANPAADAANQAMAALDSFSRRIEDLARELDCLGYFDDDDDRPRAA
jgi:hypothetical protein